MASIALTLALLVTPTPPTHACQTITQCRTDLVRARASIRWQKHERRRYQRIIRVEYHRSSVAAIHVAAIVTNTSADPLLRVAWCESRFDPFAVNGRYHGLFQLGGFHLDDPIFAWMPWSDPLANALHAARYVAAHGGSFQQWSCKP